MEKEIASENSLFIKPMNFMRKLSDKPLILLPLIVLVVVNITYTLGIYPAALESLLHNLDGTNLEKEVFLENETLLKTITCFINVFNFVLGTIGIAIVFYFLANLFIDKINFKSVLSLFLFSQVPNALNWLLVAMQYQFFNLVPSSFLDKDLSLFDNILDSLNIFFILHLIMMAVSFKILLNSKTWVSIFIVVLYSLIMICGRLFLT
ncbi:YIP1 family protein [Bacillus haynesii]|uniref:YIP1 family protein n=1 Tax=Bacillus haynesii TaxID=1925021 RepID=UPI001F620033|nr:YIP1 family protein [Bacillus haynesii]MCI4127509.1 YIP1 family protein [Bacillus haynesii]